MLTLGKDAPVYLPSALLSKKIRLFNEHATKLLPYLKKNTNFIELDTGSQSFDKSFKEICTAVEPTVLHIRSYADQSHSDELYGQMMWTLTNNHGYADVNVNELISLENERRTEIGKTLLALVSTGKMLPADLITRMLRRVVFSGDGRTKYILSGGFPFTIDHAKEFERSVSSISAVIYSAMQ